MDYLIIFLVGLLIGWLIEYIIDWKFWRRSTDEEQAAASKLNNANAELQTALADAKGDNRRLQLQLEQAEAAAAEAGEQSAAQARSQAEAQQLRAQLAALQADVANQRQRADDASKELQSAQARAEKAEAASNANVGSAEEMTRLNRELTQSRVQVEALQRENRELKQSQQSAAPQPLLATSDNGAELDTLNNKVSQLEAENRKLAAQNLNLTQRVGASKVDSLQAKCDDCDSKLHTANARIRELEANLQNTNAKLKTTAAAASSTVPRPKNDEDLKFVKGIGPKIEQILNGGGIVTFAQLAETSVERIQELLNAAGERYRLADPTTWPQQAAVAATGDWDALHALQLTIDSF